MRRIRNKALHQPNLPVIKAKKVKKDEQEAQTCVATSSGVSGSLTGSVVQQPAARLVAEDEAQPSTSTEIALSGKLSVKITSNQTDKPESLPSPIKTSSSAKLTAPLSEPSSSEDEGVIDPYDPNNPIGTSDLERERARGPNRKNARIGRCFIGGKPTSMIDYMFYNPRTNPMISSPGGRGAGTPKRCAEEDGEQDPDDPAALEDREQDDAPPLAQTVQVKIGPDGNIHIDEKSLVLETTEARQGRALLNKSPISCGPGFGSSSRVRSERIKWTQEETVFFYKCLYSIGTDFEMISKYFPNRTRHHIKLKFKLEERQNPELINKALAVGNLDTTEIDEQYLEVAQRASEERAGKRKRTPSKGAKGRRRRRSKSKTNGPRRSRKDYYLSEEEDEASGSSEDEEEEEALEAELRAHMEEPETKPTILQQRLRVKQEAKQASQLAASGTGPLEISVEPMSAVLEVAEERANEGRTLDPTDVGPSEVASMLASSPLPPVSAAQPRPAPEILNPAVSKNSEITTKLSAPPRLRSQLNPTVSKISLNTTNSPVSARPVLEQNHTLSKVSVITTKPLIPARPGSELNPNVGKTYVLTTKPALPATSVSQPSCSQSSSVSSVPARTQPANSTLNKTTKATTKPINSVTQPLSSPRSMQPTIESSKSPLVSSIPSASRTIKPNVNSAIKQLLSTQPISRRTEGPETHTASQSSISQEKTVTVVTEKSAVLYSASSASQRQSAIVSPGSPVLDNTSTKSTIHTSLQSTISPSSALASTGNKTASVSSSSQPVALVLCPQNSSKGTKRSDLSPSELIPSTSVCGSSQRKCDKMSRRKSPLKTKDFAEDVELLNVSDEDSAEDTKNKEKANLSVDQNPVVSTAKKETKTPSTHQNPPDARRKEKSDSAKTLPPLKAQEGVTEPGAAAGPSSSRKRGRSETCVLEQTQGVSVTDDSSNSLNAHSSEEVAKEPTSKRAKPKVCVEQEESEGEETDELEAGETSDSLSDDDSDVSEEEFLLKAPGPTRSGRIPKTRLVAPEETEAEPRMRRLLTGKQPRRTSRRPSPPFSKIRTPEPEPEPCSSPEPSEQECVVSDGSSMPPGLKPGTLVVFKRPAPDDPTKELLEVFMVPPLPNSGATLGHNPDGSVNTVCVGRAASSAASSGRKLRSASAWDSAALKPSVPKGSTGAAPVDDGVQPDPSGPELEARPDPDSPPAGGEKQAKTPTASSAGSSKPKPTRDKKKSKLS